MSCKTDLGQEKCGWDHSVHMWVMTDYSWISFLKGSEGPFSLEMLFTWVRCTGWDRIISVAQYCCNFDFAQGSDLKTWQLKPASKGFNFALVLVLMNRAKFIKNTPCTIFNPAYCLYIIVLHILIFYFKENSGLWKKGERKCNDILENIISYLGKSDFSKPCKSPESILFIP